MPLFCAIFFYLSPLTKLLFLFDNQVLMLVIDVFYLPLYLSLMGHLSLLLVIAKVKLFFYTKAQ